MDTINTTPTKFADSNAAKVLLWSVVTILVIAALAFLMTSLHSTGNMSGALMMFDEDMSGSVIGWMIAIPVLIIALVITVVALAGVGVILAGVVAMVVVLALVSIVFGLAMTILPVAAFLAVPVLIVWAIVKLVSRRSVAARVA
jgi:hypothetical protein